jgi:hypothetical protein
MHDIVRVMVRALVGLLGAGWIAYRCVTFMGQSELNWLDFVLVGPTLVILFDLAFLNGVLLDRFLDRCYAVAAWILGKLGVNLKQ